MELLSSNTCYFCTDTFLLELQASAARGVAFYSIGDYRFKIKLLFQVDWFIFISPLLLPLVLFYFLSFSGVVVGVIETQVERAVTENQFEMRFKLQYYSLRSLPPHTFSTSTTSLQYKLNKSLILTVEADAEIQYIIRSAVIIFFIDNYACKSSTLEGSLLSF